MKSSERPVSVKAVKSIEVLGVAHPRCVQTERLVACLGPSDFHAEHAGTDSLALKARQKHQVVDVNVVTMGCGGNRADGLPGELDDSVPAAAEFRGQTFPLHPVVPRSEKADRQTLIGCAVQLVNEGVV